MGSFQLGLNHSKEFNPKVYPIEFNGTGLSKFLLYPVIFGGTFYRTLLITAMLIATGFSMRGLIWLLLASVEKLLLSCLMQTQTQDDPITILFAVLFSSLVAWSLYRVGDQ